MYILKQIMVAVESAARKDYHVKLNLRIGFLKFKNLQVIFDNLATHKQLDQLTKTTCNTAFKANKQLMTNIRS